VIARDRVIRKSKPTAEARRHGELARIAVIADIARHPSQKAKAGLSGDLRLSPESEKQNLTSQQILLDGNASFRQDD